MTLTAGPSTLFAGVAFGLSLIVAFGAQNTFVLRQGTLREYVFDVVLVCAASDVVLIAIGVSGAGAALKADPRLLTPVRVVGAAFLLAYAAIATRRVLRASGTPRDTAAARPSRLAVVGASFAFTWLNPAVYLDTVIVLGVVANAHPGRQWWFAGGAAVASIVWFALLGFGARLLTPLLRGPTAWRALDAFVALTMLVTAWRVLGAG